MSDLPTTPPVPRIPAYPVAAAFVLMFALGATVSSLGAALPFLRERYGIDIADGGSVIGAYNIGALIATVTCGIAERRMAARPTVLGLLALFVAGLTGAGLGQNWVVFITSIVVAGVGYGGLVLYLNTAFANTFGHRSVLMVNFLNAAFGIGAILGPVATAAVSAFDVRLALLGIAALALPCWAAARCCEARRVEPGAGTATAPVRTVLLIAAPFVLVGFSYSGLETSIGTWASTHLTWSGIDVAQAALLTSLFWAGLAVGRVVVPLVAKDVRPATIVCSGFGCAVVMLSMGIWVGAPAVFYCAAGFALGPVLPTTLVWLGSAAPRAQLANSIVLTGCMAANVVHPWIMGELIAPGETWSIPTVLTAFAALGLAAAFATALLRRTPPAGSSPSRDEDSADSLSRG